LQEFFSVLEVNALFVLVIEVYLAFIALFRLFKLISLLLLAFASTMLINFFLFEGSIGFELGLGSTLIGFGVFRHFIHDFNGRQVSKHFIISESIMDFLLFFLVLILTLFQGFLLLFSIKSMLLIEHILFFKGIIVFILHLTMDLFSLLLMFIDLTHLIHFKLGLQLSELLKLVFIE
jgi:hypothetical protein